MMSVLVREAGPSDTDAILQCVVELQEFERTLDPRLPPGASMAGSYWADICRRCGVARGAVFVADVDASVVGFVAVLAEQPFEDLDDPPGTYGLVTDLVVRASSRGRGIGRMLLARAEAFTRDAGACELRVGVLARNAAARRLYLDAGFRPYLETLTKAW